MKDDFNRYLWINFGILFGVIVIAVVALYLFTGDIISRSNAILADRALIARQNASLAAFAEIKNDSAEAAKYKTVMDKLLPTQSEIINFQTWLQSFEAAYGVTTNFSFTANIVPSTQTKPGTIGFSLTVQGSSSNVLSFLRDIESQAPDYLLSFDSINISQNGENTEAVASGNIFFR